MFYYFLYPLREQWFVFNLFKYITFRSVGASITAFLVCLILGPAVTRWLKILSAVGSTAQVDERSHLGHGLPACLNARRCAFWRKVDGGAHPVSFFLLRKKRVSYAVTCARNRETRSPPSELHGYVVTSACAPTCMRTRTHAPACTRTHTHMYRGARNRVTA